MRDRHWLRVLSPRSFASLASTARLRLGCLVVYRGLLHVQPSGVSVSPSSLERACISLWIWIPIDVDNNNNGDNTIDNLLLLLVLPLLSRTTTTDYYNY
jgi:hypothetical protein